MKKTILILALGLILISQTLFAQVPSYVSTNGLVGYWSFNGNANDESGNANNGTVNGATLTTDRFGNANSAYNFVSTNNNYITINNTVGNFGTSDFTISIWFLSTDSNSSHLINKRFNQSWGNYWELTKDLFAINDTNNNSNYGFINNTQLQSQNVWYNFMVTRIGKSLKYYINGVLYQTVTTSIVNNISNTNNLVIGSVITPLSGVLQSHDGKIDDIGMWNRALTQSEITAMYNGVTYSDTCNAVSGSLTNGLVGYWPFCGNANDDSGNGNNGSVNGATLTTDRFGNSNSAYNFNGTSDYIQTSNTSSLPIGSSSRSVSYWMKSSSSQSYMTVLGYGDNLNQKDFHVWHNWNCNGVGINISYVAKTYTTGNLDDVWNHYVFVYDSSVDASISSVNIYKNGVLLTNICSSIGNENLNTGNLYPLTFGKYHATNQRYFNGLLDDIALWNRALTQEEITQLYTQNQCMTNITVTDTLIINVGKLSYTNPITYANNITLYPNPANTQVNISFTNITDLTGGHVNIINSLGQQVATTPITLSGTNTTLGLTTWGGSGLYFVQIINSQGQIVDIKKIILQ